MSLDTSKFNGRIKDEMSKLTSSMPQLTTNISNLVAAICIPLLIIINLVLFYINILTPHLLTVELFMILLIIFMIIAINYTSMYTSSPESVTRLLSVRNQALGLSIDRISASPEPVCLKLSNKSAPYNHASITDSNIALLNWSPLTVRLAGYLGGDASVTNGVFDMANGIKYAIKLGARSFVFDIDYLDVAPCEPLLIHRDAQGNKASLNTGSIREGMEVLNDKAFMPSNNNDPVIIVLYLNRVPPGTTQRSSFFNAIAKSMNPISANHLGLSQDGNFHNCASESMLFTGDITNYQKKFIVLCNYDTTLLTRAPNPKDNLNFWVNARLWKNANSSKNIGSVTTSAPTGTTAYATVGSTTDFLSLSNEAKTTVLNSTVTTYTIALGPVEEILTKGTETSPGQLDILITGLGIHSVPMDVIRLGESPNYTATLKNKKLNPLFADIIRPSSEKDQLSYWTYADYYRFNHA